MGACPKGKGRDKRVSGGVFQVERAAGASQEHEPGASVDNKEARVAEQNEQREQRAGPQRCDPRGQTHAALQQTTTTGRLFAVKWEGTPYQNFLGNL